MQGYLGSSSRPIHKTLTLESRESLWVVRFPACLLGGMSTKGIRPMPLPQPEDILALSTDAIAEFIADQRSSRSLHVLMQRLNERALSCDDMANRAIQHLGFAVEA